ncbi:MAG TPA: AAA family ATPase [Phycisphaerae bacterium]|nr:AAA family ATPase [Phycisphaerae bacterium]
MPSVPSSPHHGVILVCPEDGPADTLQPRLAAAGADLASICILEGVTDTLPSSSPPEPRTLNPEPSPLPFSLPAHADVLEQAIRAVNQPRLVILDPLHASLSPDAQARLDAIVGRLAETADRYMVAIVAVCHLAKARAHRMLYRVRGSSALIAGARAAHLLAADPHEPDRRILCPLKTVYAPPAPALAFRIVPGPRLEWQAQPLVRESLLAPGQAGIPSGPQPLCATADPALSRGWSASPDLLDLSGDAQSALSDASAWLLDYLAAGPRPARKVLRAARAAGVSIATLRRAKRICRVRSVKPDLQSAWLWLPEQPSDNKDAPIRGAHK